MARLFLKMTRTPVLDKEAEHCVLMELFRPLQENGKTLDDPPQT